MGLVFIKTTAVFFIAFLGAILHKKVKLDLRTLTEIIVYLGVPSLTFSTISRHQYAAETLGHLFVAMFILFIAMFLLTRLVFFRVIAKKKIVYLTTCFMNTAGMGFPVTLFLLGEEAFSYAVVLDLSMVLVMFSLGIGLLDKNAGLWGAFKLPVIYAALVGFFFSFSSIETPKILAQIIATLGNISIPLMLISLGARLSELKIGASGLILSLKAAAVRVFGGGTVGFLIASFAEFPEPLRPVFILYSMLPAPLMSYVLASKYGENDILAAEIIMTSTLLSFILIPIAMSSII